MIQNRTVDLKYLGHEWRAEGYYEWETVDCDAIEYYKIEKLYLKTCCSDCGEDDLVEISAQFLQNLSSYEFLEDAIIETIIAEIDERHESDEFDRGGELTDEVGK